MKDIKNKFTLIFLFTEDLEEVLLIYKIKGPYPNAWNGLGGKIQQGETALEGAERELKEETAIKFTKDRLKFVMTSIYYNTIELNVYCAKVNKKEIAQVEDEPQKWFKVDSVLYQNYFESTTYPLAGDENILHFIIWCLRRLENE